MEREAMPIKSASEKSRGAYAVARRVFNREITREAGARDIHARFGMNLNSARDHFYVYRQMRNGSVFHRALSAPDIEYYLSRIHEEEGGLASQIAMHALWLHIGYYEGVRKTRLHALRSIAAQWMAKSQPTATVEQSDLDFAKKVEAARKRTPEERQKRLATAARRPSRKPMVLLAFARNPDVVAEVLHRASGHCEECTKPAPFARKKDKTPYLEVHHIVQLADGGEDTVENAQALCPNCHRCAHFGEAK